MKKKKLNFYELYMIILIIMMIISSIDTIHGATVNNDVDRNIYINSLIDSKEFYNTYRLNKSNTVSKKKSKKKKKKYTKREIYELAKIIMCEAEGESQKCKEYVGQVVINRVKSNKFPNNIHDVIFQRNQFTPIFDGRWERVEPNKECYKAAYKVINSNKPLTKALYFEACIGDSWHSRNLTKVAKIDSTRFYIE